MPRIQRENEKENNTERCPENGCLRQKRTRGNFWKRRMQRAHSQFAMITVSKRDGEHVPTICKSQKMEERDDEDEKKNVNVKEMFRGGG